MSQSAKYRKYDPFPSGNSFKSSHIGFIYRRHFSNAHVCCTSISSRSFQMLCIFITCDMLCISITFEQLSKALYFNFRRQFSNIMVPNSGPWSPTSSPWPRPPTSSCRPSGSTSRWSSAASRGRARRRAPSSSWSTCAPSRPTSPPGCSSRSSRPTPSSRRSVSWRVATIECRLTDRMDARLGENFFFAGGIFKDKLTRRYRDHEGQLSSSYVGGCVCVAFFQPNVCVLLNTNSSWHNTTQLKIMTICIRTCVHKQPRVDCDSTQSCCRAGILPPPFSIKTELFSQTAREEGDRRLLVSTAKTWLLPFLLYCLDLLFPLPPLSPRVFNRVWFN